MTELSILVATRNRADLLSDAVKSIFISADKIVKDFEILILDQSDLRNKEFDNSKSVRYFYLQEKGKSKALNFAVTQAKSNNFFVMDDDCLMDQNTLGAITAAFKKLQHKELLVGRVVAGPIEFGKVLTISHDSLENETVFCKKILTPMYKMSGGNFGFKMQDYKKIGAFNEDFGPGSKYKSAEDNEWGFRSLNLGFSVRYIPNVRIVDRSWRTEEQIIVQFVDYGYSNGAFFHHIVKKHFIDVIYNLFVISSQTIIIYLSFNDLKIKRQNIYLTNFLKGFFDYGK